MPDVCTFAPCSAATTASASVPFFASAAFAVSAFVDTVNVKVARSGTVTTVPLPETVIDLVSGVAAACPGRGCATPARAAAPKTTRTARRIFMTLIRHRRRRCHKGLSRGGVQVRRPALGDPRRGELDEEHGLRRTRRRVQDHPDLLERAVALPQVAGRTRRDDVLPHRLPALRARDDVVERQP